MLRAATTLVFLLGIVSEASARENRVHVGKVLEVSRSEIDLGSRDGSILSIGFFGEAEVLEQLDELRVGEEVRAVFGSGTRPGESRPINKLLSIRRCEKNDQECAADRRAEEAEGEASDRVYAASQKRAAKCNRAMQRSLRKDPRYVPDNRFIRLVSEDLLKQVSSTDAGRVCANKIMQDHQAAVFAACELHHCGDSVAGGCAHIAGNSLSAAAMERATVQCANK